MDIIQNEPVKGYCACGQALHYLDKNMQNKVQELVDELGEFIPVSVGSRTFMVQRHYIALHGIKGVDLTNMGWKEIKNG